MPSSVFAVLRLLPLCLAMLATAWAQTAIDVRSLPKPTGYVSDLAHVLSPEDKAKLEQFCGQVEHQIGVQFALVTIPSLHGEPVQDFAHRLFRAWGIGDKKTNQGVLLVLAIQDRQSDIETGYGVEPYLGDGVSGSILRSLRPDLRNGDYGTALLRAAQAMAAQIAQAKGVAFTPDTPSVPPPAQTDDDDGVPVWLIIVGIFFFLWFLGLVGSVAGRSRRRFGRVYAGSGGFWPGYVAGTILSNAGRRRDGDGGSWGSGGGFGGDSGGGGGFGGFGGGDSGGGGANSSW